LKKIAIKIMRVKIKIKNKLEGNKKNNKRKKNQNIGTKLEKKIKHNKFELKDKSENHQNLDKKIK